MRDSTIRRVTRWAEQLAGWRHVVVRAYDALVARDRFGIHAWLRRTLVVGSREARRAVALLVTRRRDVARAGVLVALVATISVSSVGLVTGGTRLIAAEQAQEQSLAEQARTDEVVLAREAAAASAQVAIDKAEVARSTAAEAAVPDETLATLDAASAQVQELVDQVREAPVATPSVTTQVRSAAPATARDQASPSPTSTDPVPTDLPVTTPQTLPDPAADGAAILDVVPTAADEIKETLPEVTVDDEALTRLLAAVDQLAESTAEVTAAAEAQRVTVELQSTYEQTVADAEAAYAAAQAAAAQTRAARLAADARSLDGYSNGQVPASALCAPAFSTSNRLRCDAAEMLDGLNQAYQARFGRSLSITDSYRSLGGQITCRETKGYLCANPGTSNHGMGLAVDLGGPEAKLGTAEHQWMLDHVAEHGWNKPGWSLPSGSKPEPWHFEFVGAP